MSFLVLVTGSRYWHYVMPIYEELRSLPEGTILIHGGANGADDMAQACAKEMCPNIIDVICFPAKWNDFGKAAGVIRNQQMIDAHPDYVLAFHNDLEGSKGTKDCVTRARKAKIPVKVVSITGGHEIASRRWHESEDDAQYVKAGRDYGQEDYGASGIAKLIGDLGD
jgi:hypothetical protein